VEELLTLLALTELLETDELDDVLSLEEETDEPLDRDELLERDELLLDDDEEDDRAETLLRLPSEEPPALRLLGQSSQMIFLSSLASSQITAAQAAGTSPRDASHTRISHRCARIQ
jgi:hypothetical protein